MWVLWDGEGVMGVSFFGMGLRFGDDYGVLWRHGVIVFVPDLDTDSQ